MLWWTDVELLLQLNFEESSVMGSIFSVVVWCVLLAAIMPILCAGMAKAHGFGKPINEGGYDNGMPRQWLAGQSGWRARANAAQANCFEALPFFIGAVVLAQQSGVDVARLEILAVIYVALRVMYVAMYIADWANARTLAWTLAFATNIAILFSGTTGT
jgi:uncharacterized MAPEG superfamily protein